MKKLAAFTTLASVTLAACGAGGSSNPQNNAIPNIATSTPKTIQSSVPMNLPTSTPTAISNIAPVMTPTATIFYAPTSNSTTTAPPSPVPTPLATVPVWDAYQTSTRLNSGAAPFPFNFSVPGFGSVKFLTPTPSSTTTLTFAFSKLVPQSFSGPHPALFGPAIDLVAFIQVTSSTPVDFTYPYFTNKPQDVLTINQDSFYFHQKNRGYSILAFNVQSGQWEGLPYLENIGYSNLPTSAGLPSPVVFSADQVSPFSMINGKSIDLAIVQEY